MLITFNRKNKQQKFHNKWFIQFSLLHFILHCFQRNFYKLKQGYYLFITFLLDEISDSLPRRIINIENYQGLQQTQTVFAFMYELSEKVKMKDNWYHILTDNSWEKLRKLSIRFCGINDQNIELLVLLKLTNLQGLKLCNNNITGKGIHQIISHNFSNLKFLNFNGNNIGVWGAKALTKFPIISLQQLWLNDCNLGSQGGKQLSKGNWNSLMVLGLFHNEINLNGMTLYLGGWRNLRRLQMTNYYRNLFLVFQVDGMKVMFFFVFASTKTKTYLWNITNTEIRKKMGACFQEKLNRKRI